MNSMSILQATRRGHRGAKRAACGVGAWLAASAAVAALQAHEDSTARLERSATGSNSRNSQWHPRLLNGSTSSSSSELLAARFTQSLTAANSKSSSSAAAALAAGGLPYFNGARWLQPAATTTMTMATPPPPPTTTLLTKTIQHEYELQRVVGEGGFGLVHAARHRVTGARVALKRVFKAGTTREKFLQEVAILRHVSGSVSSGVLQLREAFETADAYVLVTELVSGGELFDALVSGGALDEQRAGSLTRELAAALAFLHAKCVVHGDVKPENILLTEEDADECSSSSVRLVDFGQAFREDKALERVRAAGSGVGTTAYAAPEVLSGTGEASAAADMWALGVVLYIMLCGRHPFDPTNEVPDDEIAARICVGAFAQSESVAEWPALSAAARDLVQRLLAVDPRARLTAEQVLQHEWVTGGSAVAA